MILDTKTKEVVQTLYIRERDSYHLEEEAEVRETLEQYGELTFSDEEDLTNSITLNEGYTLFPVPAIFANKGSDQRAAVTVTGKAGSGKSFFVAQYVDAYHEAYPKNRVFYVSLNRIARDPSYEKLLKKVSFQKVLQEVDPRKITTSLDSGSFENVLFIFDDILDVEIPVCPVILQRDYVKEKEKSYFEKEKAKVRTKEEKRKELCERKGLPFRALTPEEMKARIPVLENLEATLMDQAVITRLNKLRSQHIRSCIHNTVENFLKNGRKYGISVITTAHRLFDRNVTMNCAADESGLVVLFPYANVSSEKLVEYLREKLCFDIVQARRVSSRTYKNYEFLAVNTTGRKFFYTSNHLEFL